MSKKYTLNREDLKKIGTGALMAGLGALLTYLLQEAANVDFGDYSVIASAVIAVLSNIVRKYFQS